MEKENISQNIDLPSTNPFEQPKEPVKIEIKDPKIKILIGLGIVLFILAILSLIAIITKKQKPKIIAPAPTPTAYIKPTIKESSIPAEFIGKFSQIENKLKTNEEFLPPQIDLETGL